VDLSARGNIGLLARHGGGLMFLIEPILSVRYHFLTVGGGARLGVSAGLTGSIGALVQGGLVWPFEHGRIELVGVAGVDRYNNLNRDKSWFVEKSDPGFDMALPFVGARIGGMALLGSRRMRGLLGASVAFEHDLRRGTKVYDFEYDGGEDWFFGGDSEPYIMQARHHYGWTRMGAFVQAGVVWGPR